MTVSSRAEAHRLADQLERSFRGGAWHGPGTLEALAGIDASKAGTQTASSTHTIAGLVRHITFWLNAAHVRIAGGGDVDCETDWPAEGPLNDAGWRQAINELERAHGRLHSALVEMDDERLDNPVSGSDPTVRGLVLGVLQHNAYHTGQIVAIARSLQHEPRA